MIDKLLSLKKYPYYFVVLWGRVVIKNVLRLRGVSIMSGGRYFGMPILTLSQNSKITIGKNCVLCSTSSRTALGVNHPVILRTLSKNAVISIGDDTGMSGGVICAAVRVQIGKECLIGANVTISDTDFHPIDHHLGSVKKRYEVSVDSLANSQVIIEDNVFIGTGVIVLKGVTIGRNSVVGAGSVVTKDVMPNSIVAGNPAIIIRCTCGGES